MPDDASLFVIFHGSWCFLDTPQYVYVKTPEMGDEHVYRAGNWLAEHELPHGSYYRLTDGVGGDANCRVDQTKHPIFRGASLAGTRETRGSHTTLLFAKPKHWYQLGQCTIQAGKLTVNPGSLPIMSQDPNYPGDNHDPQHQATTACAFNVFEYSYNTCCKPKIAGMDWWTPNAIPDYLNRGKAATLHFFAEHEASLRNLVLEFKHFSDAFQAGSWLLGGDLSVSQEFITMGRIHPPPLLEKRMFEFMELSTRTGHLERLGAGLATLNSTGVPTNDALDSYWRKNVEKHDDSGLLDLPLATCLPNGGSGGGC